jgi:hypothetical protein
MSLAGLKRGATLGIVSATVLLAGLLAGSSPAAGASPDRVSAFKGVNWADPRDNYATDPVVPSGLSISDGYAKTFIKASGIISGFRTNLGANTVRLPINPYSVGTAWWSSYRAAIDAALLQRMKVILTYWEGSGTAKDGLVDDTAAWNAMWDTVVARYGGNSGVYFEPMNEPFGYTLDQWVSQTSSWLSRHRHVPRGRVFISGSGYNDNVTGVGAAPQLRGTLLSLHFYGFWASYTTEAEWTADLAARIGKYADRTVIDEAGAPMTTGLNYGAHNGNIYTSYFAAVTDTARANRMGIVYWPGLRTGDAYSMLSQSAKGLVPNSATGVAQLKWGYGYGSVPPVNDDPPAPPGEVLRGVGSGRCVDVPGFSTTNGTQLDLWDCNGGGNQSWNVTSAGTVTIYGNKCMEVGGDGVSAGSPVQINDCLGSARQLWAVNADLSVVNPATGLCLAVSGGATGNGASVDVQKCDGAVSQQWTQRG